MPKQTIPAAIPAAIPAESPTPPAPPPSAGNDLGALGNDPHHAASDLPDLAEVIREHWPILMRHNLLSLGPILAALKTESDRIDALSREALKRASQEAAQKFAEHESKENHDNFINAANKRSANHQTLKEHIKIKLRALHEQARPLADAVVGEVIRLLAEEIDSLEACEQQQFHRYRLIYQPGHLITALRRVRKNLSDEMGFYAKSTADHIPNALMAVWKVVSKLPASERPT